SMAQVGGRTGVLPKPTARTVTAWTNSWRMVESGVSPVRSMALRLMTIRALTALAAYTSPFSCTPERGRATPQKLSSGVLVASSNHWPKVSVSRLKNMTWPGNVGRSPQTSSTTASSDSVTAAYGLRSGTESSPANHTLPTLVTWSDDKFHGVAADKDVRRPCPYLPVDSSSYMRGLMSTMTIRPSRAAIRYSKASPGPSTPLGPSSVVSRTTFTTGPNRAVPSLSPSSYKGRRGT